MCNFLLFFSAGMETTSHLATALFWLLRKNPECLEKVKEEINFFIKKESDINTDNLS